TTLDPKLFLKLIAKLRRLSRSAEEIRRELTGARLSKERRGVATGAGAPNALRYRRETGVYPRGARCGLRGYAGAYSADRGKVTSDTAQAKPEEAGHSH